MQFSTTSYEPHATLPTHTREVNYMSVVLGGSYEEVLGSNRFECLPLSVRLHPAGEEHAHKFGAAGARCFNLELPRSWQAEVDRVLTALDRPMMVPCSHAGTDVVPLITRIHAGEVEALEDLAVALFERCEGVVALQRAPARHRGVQRAIERINDQVTRTWSLTQLAEDADLHPTHFARSFKAITGRTVGEYIRLRRCAHAQRLLANQKMSISRVALASGFADHAHFTRTLRAVTGLSPTQYRSLLRNV